MIRTIAHLVLALLAWLIIQFVLNVVASLLVSLRGEQSNWLLWAFKNILSPGFSAYYSLILVQKYIPIEKPGAQFLGFVCLILVATIFGIAYNSEHFLLSNRVEAWRDSLWGSILGAIAAIVGAFKNHRERI
jgi:nicotinamide riboside transporter PnuC